MNDKELLELEANTVSRCDLQQLFAAAVAREREECAKVCDAKAAKWRKEAVKHLPRRNPSHRSDHAEDDFARAAICDADAAAIRLRSNAMSQREKHATDAACAVPHNTEYAALKADLEYLNPTCTITQKGTQNVHRNLSSSFSYFSKRSEYSKCSKSPSL